MTARHCQGIASSPKRVTFRSPIDKHVNIPSYLYKRKLELGNSISAREAERYYKERILKRAFKKLKYNWFERRVQWRFLLRADLHYTFTLKRSMYCKWRYIVLLKRERVLQIRIAYLHYWNKIRIKYFLYLKKAKQVNELHREISWQYTVYAVYLFLQENFLTLYYINQELQFEFHVLMAFLTAFKTRTLRNALQCLQLYRCSKLTKRNNNELIKLFRKRKYDPEHNRIYFEKWQNFTQHTIIERLRYEIAQKCYQNKLYKIYFFHLKCYKDYRKIKAENKKIANDFHNKGLITHAFQVLKMYKYYRTLKRSKIQEMKHLYIARLKRKYLYRLINFKDIEKEEREIIFQIDQKFKNMLIKKCFLNIKKFRILQIAKRKNNKYAMEFYKYYLLNKCLTSLKNYAIFHRNKRMGRQKILDDFFKYKNLKTLNYYFIGLKLYKWHHDKKNKKAALADRIYRKNMLVKCFRFWKCYSEIHRLKSDRERKLQAYYHTILKRNIVKRWRICLQITKHYQRIMGKAKEIYFSSLIQDGIRVILFCAFERQKYKQTQEVQKMCQTYLISSKYFKKWKIRSTMCSKLTKKATREKITESNEIMDNSGLHITTHQNENILKHFEWHPMCFQSPHVPKYLKEEIIHRGTHM